MIKFLLISYLCLFGGVYLILKCIELIGDYLRERNLKVERIPCSLERDQVKRSDDDIEDDWWFANR